MALSISEKGKRVVQLIKAVRAAGEIVPGAKVLMPEERPATYIGPVMDDDIQMHEFHFLTGRKSYWKFRFLSRNPAKLLC